MAEKTEEPTQQRLAKARRDGEMPSYSAGIQALSTALMLISLQFFVLNTAHWLKEFNLAALELIASPRLSADYFQLLSRQSQGMMSQLLSFPTIGAVAALLSGAWLYRGQFSPKAITPDLKRINPSQGLIQLFSLEKITAIFRATLFALALFWSGIAWAKEFLPQSIALLREPRLYFLESETSYDLPWLQWLSPLIHTAASLLLAFGLLESFLAHRQFKKKLRMSPAEIKQESKDSDGDPELKAARKRAHQELLEGSQLNQLKQAKVLIMNPTHIAIALSYAAEEGGAPEIIAKGHGDFAQRLKKAAIAYGVPVITDKYLARSLANFELGEEIPSEFYEAIAEIFHLLEEEDERF